ncbi:hypothetical protein UFOVP239_30 [uncultured Caudovirales phage]|uniref:Uncharacterized protein n=1 Tax=uncultured Caudovirales phage TaxID=2100421 RepID=A0A6J7WV81_9CAUD|nr:hypothetical protein UFOVP239_30 [uncultured Caudovirales phage]
MIHYHGTPITPKNALESMKGEHFCISYFRPDNLKTCLKIGQSLMFDNGAFSCKTRDVPFDLDGFYGWVDPLLGHPHWAVVPDIIDGSVEDQKKMVKTWPYPKAFGMPVWHLALPIEYLIELCDDWGKVCFGSSGQFWQIGSPAWSSRMDEAFNALHKAFGARLPWVHGLRMLGQGSSHWPLASADSTNVGVNHKRGLDCAGCMAKKIDAQNPAVGWTEKYVQKSFL